LLLVEEEAEMLFFVEALLGFITFFSIGWICLVWPERVQQWSIRYYSRHSTLARFTPFLWWVRSTYYPLQLRLIGIVAILGSLILLFGIVGEVL
jgi:hypothetical protein